MSHEVKDVFQIQNHAHHIKEPNQNVNNSNNLLDMKRIRIITHFMINLFINIVLVRLIILVLVNVKKELVQITLQTLMIRFVIII